MGLLCALGRYPCNGYRYLRSPTSRPIGVRDSSSKGLDQIAWFNGKPGEGGWVQQRSPVLLLLPEDNKLGGGCLPHPFRSGRGPELNERSSGLRLMLKRINPLPAKHKPRG